MTLAVLQALLGFAHETHWLRHSGEHLTHLFPYLPGQAGCWLSWLCQIAAVSATYDH